LIVGGEVSGESVCVAAEATRDLGQHLRAAIGQADRCATGGQRVRDCSADITSRSGYERGLTVK
jgi:hypothetical protein